MTHEQPIFADSSELRQEVIDTCLYLHDRLGYFVSTWGNISVRLEAGLLVTPSRMSYKDLKVGDLVVVSWEGSTVIGSRLPTSETELHRQIMLERSDLGALVHSHSPYASVVASCHKSIPVLVDDMAEVIGGEVNCAAYVSAGEHKRLAQSARQAIGREACAVLLANHGVVAGGRDLAEALVASQFVEKAAMIMVLGQSLGGARPIAEELWRAERHRYIHKYGTAEDFAGLLNEADEDV